MSKKTCRGVFYKDKDKMTEEEVKKDIICVPNKAGTPMFYKLDYKTGNFKFIGYESLMIRCFEDEELDLPNCKHTSGYSINPDYHLIKVYLAALENDTFATGQIKRDTLSELEELKAYDPTNKVWEDKTYIENIERKFKENESKIQIAPHINTFITNLAEYTDITLQKLDEMFNGAYTIIKGDKGLIYQKYFNDSEEQISTAEKKGIKHASVTNPLAYTYSYYSAETDKTKMDTIVPNRQYKPSSHPSNDYTQLRIGAGSIINCNKRSNSCINEKFELLMGTSTEKGSIGDTWFQFENSRMDTRLNWLSHFFDAVPYLAKSLGAYFSSSIKKKNLGPFGYSDYTDTNPQYLYICNADDIKDRQSGELDHCIHRTVRKGISKIEEEPEEDEFSDFVGGYNKYT